MRKWNDTLVHVDNLRTVRLEFEGMEETERQEGMLSHRIGDKVSFSFKRSDVGTMYVREGIVVGISLSHSVAYDVAFAIDMEGRILSVVKGIDGAALTNLEKRPKLDVSVLPPDPVEVPAVIEQLEAEELAPMGACDPLPVTWLSESFYEGTPHKAGAHPSRLIVGGLGGAQSCPFRIGDTVRMALEPDLEENPRPAPVMPTGTVCAIHIGQTFSYDVAFPVLRSTMLAVVRRIEADCLTHA